MSSGGPGGGSSRWGATDAPRGDDYDRRFAALAASGHDVHGEASFVHDLLSTGHTTGSGSVLDAGCGTGRVAIELARRGHDVCGVDLDTSMLAAARRNAPHLEWVEADLAALDLRDADGGRRRFDVAVLAGNVMIFVAPGTEPQVLAQVAHHVCAGGAVVTGFQLQAGRYGLAALDADAAATGLVLDQRWATWDRDPWQPGGDYAVSVFRRS